MSEGASSAIQLIAGLGNPGSEYAETRHNAGAWVVEALCRKYHVKLKNEAKFHARFAEVTINGQTVKLLISTTYMNHSGQALGAVATYYKIPIQAILIAHDELDLPIGSVRLKMDGGHGGHNGLRDIIHHLKGRNFHRLRIGIGHPGNREQVLDYVLSRPSESEALQYKKAIDETLQVLPNVISGNFQNAMNRLHSFSSNEEG